MVWVEPVRGQALLKWLGALWYSIVRVFRHDAFIPETQAFGETKGQYAERLATRHEGKRPCYNCRRAYGDHTYGYKCPRQVGRYKQMEYWQHVNHVYRDLLEVAEITNEDWHG